LLEKITARIHTWATRNLSFAGRARLINNVIFGSFSYWASIFLLPNAVIERLTQLCRNYLWSGSAEFKRVPHFSWTINCQPKSKGGIGLKNFASWNKATMVKLVWAISNKKDVLWVKWVHSKHLKDRDWCDYTPPHDSS